MPTYIKVGTKYVNTEHLWYAEMTLDDNSRKILRVWFTNGNRLELQGADAAAMVEYLNAHQYVPAPQE